MGNNSPMNTTEKSISKAQNEPSPSPEGLFGRIVLDDCLHAAASLPKSCLDLIYIDPPYFTKRNHTGRDRTSTTPDSPQSPSPSPLTFIDRWQGGRHEYLDWLHARLTLLHPLLRPTGNLLLHLDWHAVHYAKVLCDQIFGDDHFQNELIWYYQTGGASKDRFSRKHDSILLYSKTDRFYFDGKSISIPRTAKSMRRARSGRGARIAADDTHKNPDDVLAVPALNPMAKERNGYPTQKPVELLERLITALTPPGGSVADFFCGSGTTLVAAQKLGRQWFGCDNSPRAIDLARKRLAASKLA